ncbi:hypothetical protein [Candidatus Methylomirabilis sp.]|uniref:hypothetical protein n=1 Tax=Candidatus Methylomirabilis sp. TaxID=2032687 RepID=UPI002A6898A1|nr:hypothetical protein [Candidatus Methylomirabilis sp.]
MDDIAGLVRRLLRGPELVIASQETIEELRHKGEQIEEIPSIPLNEALDKLFTLRRQNASDIVFKLPACPSTEAPVLYLYDEIRQCILFGLNGTAITLSGILVEFMLKYATFRNEQGGKVEFDSEVWKRFEDKLTMRPAIDRAKRNGLISDPQAVDLHRFADSIRNTYAHFNIQRLTSGAVFRKVRVRSIRTGEEELKDIPATQSPAFQILAKARIDSENVLKIFEFADSVVRHLTAVASGEANAGLKSDRPGR